MEVTNKKFAIFILTHGRPNKVLTYRALKKQGYTGKIYIIIDNEDKTAKEYYKNFDNVVMFDKKAIAETFDVGDNFNKKRNSIVYARNASFNIAKDLGVEYFMQFDDDYTTFRYTADENGKYLTKSRHIKNLDTIFNILLKYYLSINAKSLCIAQGGDFIGGDQSRVFKHKLVRKAMNSFLCSIHRPFQFIGRINEDVNIYTSLGSKGDLFLTIADLRLEQLDTQTNKGGMTDLYLDSGTYIKSFYTVMFAPSCTKINRMGNVHKRLHHRISWNNAVPCIVKESLKK
tara:strand:+ start:1011 stop:1871 length:861 start_codon:yes stop_codon:yes gene_type:complete